MPMSQSFRISLPDGKSFAARAGENLLVAAQRAHWLIRYGCRNGNCLACTATLKAGSVSQRDDIIDAADGEREILLCLAYPRADLHIEFPGNALHGSAEHARRSYVQVLACDLQSSGWTQLTLQMPAGKPLPLYPGQRVMLETTPPLFAEVGADALHGRELNVLCAVAPPVETGARLHIHYPLGYTYRSAVMQPLWILHDAAMQARAQLLRGVLAADATIDMSKKNGDMSQERIEWPAATTPISIIAVSGADTDAELRHWYARLLVDRVRFTEMRSDSVILQPWRVCRQDDNGNRFTLAEFLDETQARAQAQQFSERGHKQMYWPEPMSWAEE